MIGHYEIVEDDGEFVVILRDDDTGEAFSLDDVIAVAEHPEVDYVIFVPDSVPTHYVGRRQYDGLTLNRLH